MVLETSTLGDDTELLSDEQVLVAGWAEARAREFAMGRACARRALRRLGLPPTPLLVAQSGGVAWPPGVVGSISHKAWACVAAVASTTDLRSIGLDLELLEPGGDLLQEVCTPAELVSWAAASGVTSSPADLVVAAKEAFFKCQHPVVGGDLSWEDVEIRFHAPSPSAFEVKGPPLSSEIVGTWDEMPPWTAAVCLLPSGIRSIGV